MYKLDKIFFNSVRRKTYKIDDKIAFHNVMHSSEFTPESYLDKEEIKDKDSLYFIKDRGTTGGKGVNIYDGYRIKIF